MRQLLRSGFMLVCLAVSGSSVAEEPDALTRKSIDHIFKHAQKCTLGDGYVCQTIEEVEVIANQAHMARRVYLDVWTIAYTDFQAIEELTVEQKNLAHYKVGFAENDKSYVVIFSALLLPQIMPDGQPEGLLRSTFGKSMRYEIDKQSKQIISRKYYR